MVRLWKTKFKKLETTNWKGELVTYRLPLILYTALIEIHHRVMNKLDGVIIITGKVGSGKSNLGDGLCGTWENFFNRLYNLDQVFFDASKVVQFTDQEGNETHPIKYDEAIQGASGKDVNTKAGNFLKITLITKRRKRHLYIFIVDEVKELSKKVISRCNLLINVTYKKERRKNKVYYQKGIFKTYSAKECKEAYQLMKKGKIETLDQYRATKKKRWYKCDKYCDIWFDEKEYDKKKIEETKLLNVVEDKVMIQRNKAIQLCLTLGATQQKVATELGMSRSRIADVKSELSSRN